MKHVVKVSEWLVSLVPSITYPFENSQGVYRQSCY